MHTWSCVPCWFDSRKQFWLRMHEHPNKARLLTSLKSVRTKFNECCASIRAFQENSGTSSILWWIWEVTGANFPYPELSTCNTGARWEHLLFRAHSLLCCRHSTITYEFVRIMLRRKHPCHVTQLTPSTSHVCNLHEAAQRTLPWLQRCSKIQINQIQL